MAKRAAWIALLVFAAGCSPKVVPLPTVTMTLTCDHRAIDGSEGADFLRTVKAFVEAPSLAL
jgi:pyruvate/2-oxoglutarate dehydrogenase complex dihydrolipoamide acyltransferase (E2) component